MLQVPMSIAGAWRRGYKKIGRIAASELALAGKFRYLLDLAAGTFLPSLRRGLPATRRGYREYRMRGDISVLLRENSTDGKVFEEIFIEKTYAPLARAITPKAPVILIDLGANIGLSAIALARELRPLAMVVVEPDRENFAMLEENMRRASLTDRCTAVQAFAGVERGFAELVDSGNGAWGMRMGAPTQAGIPVLPLEEIIDMGRRSGTIGRNVTVVLKCDIEGAETHLFHRLPQWEDRVHYVILELHTEFLSLQEFHACLDASRYHWRIEGAIPPDAVLAVIGLERLEWKATAQSQRAAGS